MTVYKKFYLLHVLFTMTLFCHIKTMENQLSPIEKALLIREIEEKGVEKVRQAMQEPALYNETYGTCFNNGVILNIQMTVYKTDTPNLLADMIFQKIEETELQPDDRPAHVQAKPYGAYRQFNDSHVRYAWQGHRGERQPKIVIEAGFKNRAAIQKILNMYDTVSQS